MQTIAERNLEIYKLRKQGETVPNLARMYGINKTTIKYLINLVDHHGVEILTSKKKYTYEFKLSCIKKVLEDGDSIRGTAIKSGIMSKKTLKEWIIKYQGNGNNVYKEKKEPFMIKKVDLKKEIYSKEDIDKIKERNAYLEAENAYLKKLKTLVQEKKK